jgi:hypothetical protein
MPTKKTKSTSDPGAKARGAGMAVDGADVKQIVTQIIEELGQLAAVEGGSVLRLIALGLLVRLQKVVEV